MTSAERRNCTGEEFSRCSRKRGISRWKGYEHEKGNCFDLGFDLPQLSGSVNRLRCLYTGGFAGSS
jgi:hypothetical protein